MIEDAGQRLQQLFEGGQLDQIVGWLDREPELMASLEGTPLELAGLALAIAGRHGDAEAAFRRAMAGADNATAGLNLGSLLLNTQRFQEALPLLEEAWRRLPEDPNAAVNLGLTRFALGQFPAAAEVLQAALARHPGNAKARVYLARALQEMGRLDPAAARVKNWMPAPDELTLNERYELALVLTATHQFEAAEKVYEDILRSHPEEWIPRVNIAGLQERANRIDEAMTLLEQVPPAARNEPLYLLTLGKLQARRGQLEQAAETLADAYMPDGTGHDNADRFNSELEFERGRVLDRLGRFAEAYDALGLANRLARDAYRRYNPPSGDENRIEWLVDDPALDAAVARARTVDDGGESPVLLVGFPRSGTTLMDQMLDGHPRLQVMEEKPAMEAAAEALSRLPGGYPRALVQASPEQIEGLRRVYWSTVARFVTRRPGSLLVDKYPLSLSRIQLGMTLFPRAKWIFAVRHPCDVVLSCFMQNFRFTDATRGFWTLPQTAAIYGQVMGLWLQQRARLQPDCLDLRYEDLVGDVEGHARRLISFLGLEWDAQVLAHTERARSRRIGNPSYRQVVEPVYTGARGRWHHYRQWLEPQLDRLAPLAIQLGYPDPRLPAEAPAPNAARF